MTENNFACRSCGADGLVAVLSLGKTPLANALLTEIQLDEPEPTFPLDLAFCANCSLVQILETVPPEELFSNYLYFSSVSDAMLRHAKQSVDQILDQRSLSANSLVVEIASNDGYLLQYFTSAGIPVLGIEPARNIAQVAEERGVRTLVDFFGPGVAQRLAAQGFMADVMMANNVMAHIPDINGVMEGIKALLKPGGVFIMETPYVKDMVDQLEFDTVYHEHVYYYSLTSLENLFRRHGLAAADVELLPIHGGSLRVTAVHAGEEGSRIEVKALLEKEKACGVTSSAYYEDFSLRVHSLCSQLRGLLQDFKASNKRIAAYGASAKGSTLLNFLQIGQDLLDFIVDRSTAKQGKYSPGTHLHIYSPEKLLDNVPDYVLLLTWNFAEEILAQQVEYRRRGGRFIIPIPEPKVI